MKAAVMAPIGLVVLCALGLVSGVLAAPRNVRAVESSAYVSDVSVGATESGAEGEVRHMTASMRARSSAKAPLLQKHMFCGAWEASAVGGSYKRCEVQ